MYQLQPLETKINFDRKITAYFPQFSDSHNDYSEMLNDYKKDSYLICTTILRGKYVILVK